MKPFTKIEPYADTVYWISGIYKIVRYSNRSYGAYFIEDWARNWGSYVPGAPITKRYVHSTGTGKQWPTLRAAKGACRIHAKSYTPSDGTVVRAAEIMVCLIAKEAESK